ncbi:MAG: helix-turn-helix domain-containing protein [Candidatus Gracilibacteria bacterium]|nr:helix-turn-helix domain-containing protein [Candidatus Gracilibacteria bacterium]
MSNNCPVVAVFGMLSKQWVLNILYNIGNGKNKFSTLKKELGAISSKTLSSRLKELQEDGIIIRSIISEQPIKIEYTLSEKGLSLSKELNNLSKWAREWRD